MNDPHVESLKYVLEPVDDLSFDAPPVTHETKAFSVHLEDEVLDVALKQHFASVDEARDCVERFLQAWEIQTALRDGRREFVFKYEDARVVDRKPPQPDEHQTISLNATLSGAGGFISAKAQTRRKKYPDPPTQFDASPDVLTLWNRYEGYKEGREPLFSMAYFCYTVLKARSGGGRNEAAKKYNISKSVLQTLTELSTRRGDEETARKFDAERPANQSEREWIDHTVRAVITQVGVHDMGLKPDKLTMDDLPDLEE